jgi:hypothetical protein
MKQILYAFLLLVFAEVSIAKPTPAIIDPKAFVTSVYQKLATDKNYSPPTDIYTRHLANLWADMEHDANGEVGRVDFEFWADGQDWQIKNVDVNAMQIWGRPDRQMVRVTFLNTEQPEDIHFYFEKVNGRWLLDDVCSIGKNGWTLSLILKYGYF